MYLGRNRKLNRLRDYDYSQNGYYFVTICTKNKQEFFGQVKNGEMILNDAGKIAEQCWLDIPVHFPDVELDEFIVMPNHVHGILIIKNDDDVTSVVNGVAGVGNKNFCSLPLLWQTKWAKSISSVIRGFKIGVTKWFRQNHHREFSWQKSYHDVIIRDEIMLNTKRQYILENPPRWWRDRNNLNKEL
jgi:REP element-mobilizing transposase RayT